MVSRPEDSAVAKFKSLTAEDRAALLDAARRIQDALDPPVTEQEIRAVHDQTIALAAAVAAGGRATGAVLRSAEIPWLGVIGAAQVVAYATALEEARRRRP